jgi:hypothetical protein
MGIWQDHHGGSSMWLREVVLNMEARKKRKEKEMGTKYILQRQVTQVLVAHDCNFSCLGC